MRASVQEQLQTFLNVVNVMVRCRSRLVAVRIQPYVLVSDPKADILWLVCIRLDTQELREKGLCSRYVLDGIDDCFDALIHVELLI